MVGYIKSAWKILKIYIMVDLLFIVFIYPFYGVSRNMFYTLLPAYCFVFFVIAALLVFFETKKLAIIEKRPYYNLKPTPFKGLILGVFAFSPFLLMGILYTFIVFNNEHLERVKHIILNTLMGPVYGFVSIGKESLVSYIAAGVAIPVICLLGYMNGFYGDKLKKQENK